MPTHTEYDPPEVVGDLDADREVFRTETEDPVHLPAFGGGCPVVEQSDNSMLLNAGALDDDKRICDDCARPQAAADERRVRR